MAGQGPCTEGLSQDSLDPDFSNMSTMLNPNLPGGGGAIMAPPCCFFNGASIPLKISHSSFMTFFFQVSRTFWHQICDARGYGSEVT